MTKDCSCDISYGVMGMVDFTVCSVVHPLAETQANNPMCHNDPINTNDHPCMKPTAHICKWPPTHGNDCLHMKIVTHAWKWLPTHEYNHPCMKTTAHVQKQLGETWQTNDEWHLSLVIDFGPPSEYLLSPPSPSIILTLSLSHSQSFPQPPPPPFPSLPLHLPSHHIRWVRYFLYVVM